MKKVIAIATIIFTAQTAYTATSAKETVKTLADARTAQIELAVNGN